MANKKNEEKKTLKCVKLEYLCRKQDIEFRIRAITEYKRSIFNMNFLYVYQHLSSY